MAESDPPRKTFRLKPKEFERVNEPLAAPPSPLAADSAPVPVPPTPDASPPAPQPGAPVDVREMARQATASGPLLRVNAAVANPPTEVQVLLRENVAQANAQGLNDVVLPPKRKSRRRRDYFLLLIPVDTLFAWMAFGPTANAVTFAYGIGGLAFYTCGLTWVFWFILDDY